MQPRAAPLLLAMMSGTTEQDAAAVVQGSRSLMRALISAMRPLQAPKNGLVLVPLIFSVNIWFAVDDLGGMAEIVSRAVAATVAFTLMSGAVYLINDLADIERDRAHPVKRRRAIASGDLPVGAARATAAIAILVAGLISIAISLPAVDRGRCVPAVKHRIHIQVEARRHLGCNERCGRICPPRLCRLRRNRWSRPVDRERYPGRSISMSRRGSTS